MGGLRGVLFDAAGTLIALREPVGETYARLARDYGVACSAGRVEEAFRRSFREAPPLAFPDASPAERPALERAWWRARVLETFRAADDTLRFTDFEAYFARLYDHFAGPSAWCAAPGSHALLAALHARGLAAGVVSNFDHRLRELLQGLELAELLDVVVLPVDTGTAKPDPRIFRVALAALGLAPGEAVYVGDDAEVDLAPARALGLRAVDVGSLATLGALPQCLGLEPGPDEESP